VAAHLEPEILLVDEVLAVGDAAFQKKCLGKMGEVAKEGRTVIFVSHNMATVQNICGRGLLLHQGQVMADDSTDTVVMHYLSLIQTQASLPLVSRLDREGNGALRFKRFHIISPGRGVTDTVCTGEKVTFVAEYASRDSRQLKNVSVSIPFFNHMGQHMFMCWTRMTGQDWDHIAPQGAFRAHIPKFSLMPGKYTVNLWCEVNGILADWVREAAVINVIEGDFFRTGHLAPNMRGGMVVEHEWQCVEDG
jgi:lipopolysaccharide transport system ATP-binding protein